MNSCIFHNRLRARNRWRGCNRSRSRQAMTLIEIMIVVVILGAIASVVIVNLIPKADTANHHLAKTQVATVLEHLQLYQLTNKKLPGSGTGLDALTSPTANPSQDYFLKPEQLMDPWGNRLIYRQPGRGGYPFEVLSLGADGQPGGEGVNADISSNGSVTGP